jgi:hypothetical protein
MNVPVHRRWHRNHAEGFDSDFEDFTPTYPNTDFIGESILLMAINGFSCGYPECCVFDFLKKWWKFAHTRNQGDILSTRRGVTEYGQSYAQCDAHEGSFI